MGVLACMTTAWWGLVHVAVFYTRGMTLTMPVPAVIRQIRTKTCHDRLVVWPAYRVRVTMG
jgi:hypothetical protein